MIRRKYVPLRIVQPGMMIDQAIIDRAGRVLIARRTRLEDFHIDALKKMGVTGIYTCEGTEDVKPADADKPQELPEPLQKKYEQVKVKDPAKVQISESVRSRVAQGVQYLYQDTQSPDFTNASRSITDDLLRAIEDNDAVAVDIGALKISDEYTFKHSVDVATMSMIVARKYGLDDKQVYEIGIAGLLHDIGKSKVPNEILNKAARLTDEEFAIMRSKGNYLSIRRDRSQYTGGVHGSLQIMGDNWLFRAGDYYLLSLTDILPGAEDPRALVMEQALEQAKQQEEGQPGLFYENYQETMGDVWQEDWYLTEESLVVVFQEYALGPYTSGPMLFEIPFTELGDNLTEELRP